MGKHERLSVSRRGLLKGLGGGALVVTIGGAATTAFVRSVGKALAQGTKPPLHPASSAKMAEVTIIFRIKYSLVE